MERVLIDFRGIIDDWGEYYKDDNGVWHAQSLEGVRMAIEGSPKGADVVLNIDSDGGSVSEGLKIYDYLTTYDYAGGQLYTNIVGGCHSMAVVVLLTAPLANRSANANIRALIHEVRTWGDDITVEEAERLAKQLQMEQDAILDIYAARTTTTRAELEEIMKEETEHTAQELLNWGFISSINSLSVNAYLKNKRLKNSNMAKSTEFYNRFVKGLRAFVNKTNNCNVCDFDYKDADGVIVFSTEGEEDNLAVGVSVVLTNGETSGTYILNDGRTVTIVDNIVTEIVETANEKNENDPAPADPAPAGGDPAPAPSKPADPAPEPPAPTANEAKLQELEALLESAKETINAQMAEIKELQTEVARLTASNHKPAGKPANAMPKTDITPSERSTEDIKNEANERRIKAFKKTFAN